MKIPEHRLALSLNRKKKEFLSKISIFPWLLWKEGVQSFSLLSISLTLSLSPLQKGEL